MIFFPLRPANIFFFLCLYPGAGVASALTQRTESAVTHLLLAHIVVGAILGFTIFFTKKHGGKFMGEDLRVCYGSAIGGYIFGLLFFGIFFLLYGR
jgi:hypothetical protein